MVTATQVVSELGVGPIAIAGPGVVVPRYHRVLVVQRERGTGNRRIRGLIAVKGA